MKNLVLAATLLLTMGAGVAQATVNGTSVPDAGSTLGLMGGALIALGVLRSKFGR